MNTRTRPHSRCHRPRHRWVCPVCAEPVRACPPRRWPAVLGPRPRHAHLDGEPLCPVIGSRGYQPGRPVPAPLAQCWRAATRLRGQR